MSNDINQIRFQRIPSPYETEFTLGVRLKGILAFTLTVSVVAFLAISIAATAFQYTQQVTLTQAFINLFTQLTTKQLLIGSAVVATLVSGTGLVIYRARTSHDELIKSPIPLSDNYARDLEPVTFEYQHPRLGPKWGVAYIDKSTLNGEKTGTAYLYAVKPCDSHYFISTLVALLTPVYTTQTIVYHALRILPIFLYTLGCWLVERCKTNSLFEGQRKFTLLDVVKQPAMSLWHIVKAPFYGLAYLSALIYSIGNPMGGRILAAKIERDWNRGRSRAEGFGSCAGAQKLWRFFGGPDQLDQFTYFIAACDQPIGVVQYANGEMVEDSGRSLTEAVEPGGGHIYAIFTAAKLQ